MYLWQGRKSSVKKVLICCLSCKYYVKLALTGLSQETKAVYVFEAEGNSHEQIVEFFVLRPDLVKDVPAHAGGLDCVIFEGPFPPKPFYGSMIFRN